jgi:septal ring-binding cell division protein DamX
MFYGAFASIGKAKMALKKLPREFKQVWIRNLIDVQNQLQSDTVVAKNQ